jgi:polyhydroxyalkanoate synthesis repressor PhaR
MKLIKRYANRKLYDTERSCYVTLEEIAAMVRDGEEIRIVDQKTSDDLTSVTLAQIIFEEEKKSRRILPLPALRSIIQSSGEFLQRISQPVQQFRDETQRTTARFLRPGEVVEEGRQAIRDYATGIQRAIDDLQRRLDERIKVAVDSLTHLPELETRLLDAQERLEHLEAIVERLSRDVSRLRDGQLDDRERRFPGRR